MGWPNGSLAQTTPAAADVGFAEEENVREVDVEPHFDGVVVVV